MYTKETAIRNESGFHVRPAQLFTEQAIKFESQITIQVKEPHAETDGKSILGLMALGLEKGSMISISAEGPDEKEAVEALVALVESGFGEA
ncbi:MULTISPECIES: HPr family phosphocarrier protein [unclassified Paenibacillus]|uniref:HPr family phosphocarrier protein n=1 Tax=unclassified Paenibacillus TaxID=185978 RepID=UPI001AE4E9F1|nr:MULTISPECIES: HPr family phosphocarrier protein [unclassified Paenibacillus]MBP1157658.1 phosphocarrier protein HPr/phosphocarrier protein [Paenibacillus sp. PvP091]MBP1171605.1 phosphocarrier protein HPr/phosphocarrier protein [Paenibacillus sp. PvR098]MBP2437986.1 phosphocarrier protein HPr/phosphocarrier protein [Paenibacillus sp. PvP052]